MKIEIKIKIFKEKVKEIMGYQMIVIRIKSELCKIKSWGCWEVFVFVF